MKLLPAAMFVCLFLFVGVGLVSAEDKKDDKPDPREKLETAIPEAIRLLEKKEHVELLKKFVSPEELKNITKSQTIEELAEGFGGKKAEEVLQALKQLKDVKPKLSDDDKKAVYTLKEAVGSKETITFIKVEKYWYIKN